MADHPKGLMLSYVDEDGTEEIYDELISAVSKLWDKGPRWARDNCHIDWATEKKNHETTYYVDHFDKLLKDPTMYIESKQTEGFYQIAPKSDHPPILRYHPPNDDYVTEEKLKSLAIYSKDFEFSEENGVQVIQWIRDFGENVIDIPG